jgi:hypothetical protein
MAKIFNLSGDLTLEDVSFSGTAALPLQHRLLIP